MKLHSLAFVTFMAVGICSCNKDEKHTTPIKENEIKRTLMRISCTPENAENLVDYSGRWHNEALDYTFNIMTLDGKNDGEEVVNGVESYFSSHLNHPVNLNADFISEQTAHYNQNGIAAFIDPSSVVGIEVIKLSEDVGKSIENGKNDYCYDIKKLITAWEKDIMANEAYRDSEKQTMLVFSSVFRYSLFYWNNTDFEVNGAPKWAVAAADAASAASYFIANPNSESVWTRIKSAVAFGTAISGFVALF